MLLRLLRLRERLEEPEALEAVTELLVDYAWELEVTRRLPEAQAVVSLARSLSPASAMVALHAGRIARKQGQRERALALYGAARALDRDNGGPARLASIGEAVVSVDPLPVLARALREAVRAGDEEAAAVALEERARIRRGGGDRAGAARDLCIAAARYSDPVDRARVAHELADLFAAAGDPLAVREALLLALAVGDGSQRDHAQARLHAVSRDLHDQVGARRWRSFQRPSLVSLSASARAAAGKSAAVRVGRWREQIEAHVLSDG
jgi:tetratricopeptide (TPR) repeat protein